MNTGGTPDVIVHGETGLLSRTVEDLARDVRRLRADGSLRARLAEGARRRAESLFDAPSVVARVNALYGELRAGRG